MEEGECESLVFGWGDGDGPIFLVDYRVYSFQPGMSEDCILFSSIDDMEADFLGNVP